MSYFLGGGVFHKQINFSGAATESSADAISLPMPDLTGKAWPLNER